MGKAGSFASLKPRLLASKGAAKPAMRIAGGNDIDALAAAQSDLGWNDHGDTQTAEINSAEQAPTTNLPGTRRRTAFTLRLDAERHLRLRLASTLQNCSAQVLVTEALDRFLQEIPQLDVVAEKAAHHQHNA